MHQQIIKFWFEELTPQNWFENNPELDKHIASRFTSVLEQAARCELFNWRDSAQDDWPKSSPSTSFHVMYRNTQSICSRPARISIGSRSNSVRTRSRISA